MPEVSRTLIVNAARPTEPAGVGLLVHPSLVYVEEPLAARLARTDADPDTAEEQAGEWLVRAERPDGDDGPIPVHAVHVNRDGDGALVALELSQPSAGEVQPLPPSLHEGHGDVICRIWHARWCP